MNEIPDQIDQSEDPELYVEPPKIGVRDALGIVIALIALSIIGYAGYVWLNPDLSAAKLFSREAVPDKGTPNAAPPSAANAESGTEAIPASNEVIQSDSMAEMSSEPAAAYVNNSTPGQPAAEKPVATPPDQPPVERETCAYCGMYADSSRGYVVATWANGAVSHHDCWDCVFSFGKDNQLTLASALVADYGAGATAATLNAADSWYLYDTDKKVEGSMPPFVAAYADQASAKSAQPAMGGEVVDFSGLKAHWD